jgi:hypothetical protein
MSLDTLIKDVIKHFKLDLSVISLILVNVITLILANIQKWDLKTIFYVYLFQTIFILFFVCIKLLLKRNICFVYIFNKYDKKTAVVDPSKNTKMVVIFTFLLMCGIAISVYFSFLVIMFGFPKLNFLMFIPVGLFFLNHLFSFIYNFKKDSKKEELAIVLIKKTIYRFLVIHFTVVCSWFFIFTFEKSVAIILSLILFFILKIPADIYFHNKEHQTTAQQFEEKRKYYRKTDIYLTKNKDRKNQNEVSEPTKKRIENLKNGSLLWTLLNKKSKNKK